MTTYCLNQINKSDFIDILKLEVNLYLTTKQLESLLFNYNNQINYYFYFHYLNKDFSEFNKYIVDDFLTIEFLTPSNIRRLIVILNAIPYNHSSDFIHLIKNNKIYNKNKNKFIKTNEFLKNNKIKKLIKYINIDDF